MGNEVPFGRRRGRISLPVYRSLPLRHGVLRIIYNMLLTFPVGTVIVNYVRRIIIFPRRWGYYKLHILWY